METTIQHISHSAKSKGWYWGPGITHECFKKRHQSCLYWKGQTFAPRQTVQVFYYSLHLSLSYFNIHCSLFSVSSASGKHNFQKLNDAYQRICEELDKGHNINMETFQARAYERPQYTYDEVRDCWTDQWGNRFQRKRYHKVKQTVDVSEEEKQSLRKAFFIFLTGLLVLELYSVMYFLHSYESGCRCRRCAAVGVKLSEFENCENKTWYTRDESF